MSAEIITKAMRAWKANDAATLSSLLTSDFTFVEQAAPPINQQAFLDYMHELVIAMPDFTFNEGAIEDQGDGHYTVKTHISGTHTGPLNPPGMPSIPGTGTVIAFPKETQIYTFVNGKIFRIELQVDPGDNTPSLLAQLGIPLPE